MDVSPLVPEAREPARQAAEVYLRHTEPWFVGLLAYGSALTGDFIPGCSDIDFNLFLKRSAFDPNGRLRLALGMDIHRDLFKIDPAPFQYIQCVAIPVPEAGNDTGRIHPKPGAYQLLAGELPVPEATADETLELASSFLAGLQPDPIDMAGRLLEHGGGRLERDIRLLTTKVWPTLFSLLALQARDPVAVWRLTKSRAIEMLPPDKSLGSDIRRFYDRVTAYYAGSRTVDTALQTVESGLAFLGEASEWYGASGQTAQSTR